MTGHAPLDHEPRSVRPPFAEHDSRFDHMRTTDPTGWRRAVHLDRVTALLEPLAGVEMSEREHAIVDWLAGWDVPTVAPVVRLLHAARASAPLTEHTVAEVADEPPRPQAEDVAAAIARLRSTTLTAPERGALMVLLGVLSREVPRLPAEVVAATVAAVEALATHQQDAQCHGRDCETGP